MRPHRRRPGSLTRPRILGDGRIRSRTRTNDYDRLDACGRPRTPADIAPTFSLSPERGEGRGEG